MSKNLLNIRPGSIVKVARQSNWKGWNNDMNYFLGGQYQVLSVGNPIWDGRYGREVKLCYDGKPELGGRFIWPEDCLAHIKKKRASKKKAVKIKMGSPTILEPPSIPAEAHGKIFVLTHAWLQPINKGVQATHAVLGLDSGEPTDPIVILETSKSTPQKDLADFVGLLRKQNIRLGHYFAFTETTQCNGGQVTAVAIFDYAMDLEVRAFLDKFKLAH